MTIKVRKLTMFKEVTIEEGVTKIELGLYDQDECEKLAAQLRQAAEQLEN